MEENPSLILSELDDEDENLLRETLNVHLNAASAFSGYIFRRIRFQSLYKLDDHFFIKIIII